MTIYTLSHPHSLFPRGVSGGAAGAASTSSGGRRGSPDWLQDSVSPPSCRREEMRTRLCHLISGVKNRPWLILFISVHVAFVCFLPYLKATYVFGHVASGFK